MADAQENLVRVARALRRPRCSWRPNSKHTVTAVRATR